MWPRTRPLPAVRHEIGHHRTDGRPIAAALGLFALGRRGLATGLVVFLNGIQIAVGRVSSSRRLGYGHG